MTRDEAWIRAASERELGLEVVDPLLLAIQQEGRFTALSEEQRALAVVWTLHAVAQRNGIASFAAEEPPWVSAAAGEAARALGLLTLAKLWERASEGMDLASAFGALPIDVQWGDPDAAAELERRLTEGQWWNLPRAHLLPWLVRRASAFATP